jgi:hypothetical protein
VGVKFAVDVTNLDQKRNLGKALEFLTANSQLRRDEGEVAVRVDLVLRCR